MISGIRDTSSKHKGAQGDANRTRSFAPQDQETFHRLYEMIGDICPAWLQDGRDDLAQKAMLRILEWVQRIDNHQELTQLFLYRVAQSVVIDETRAARRERNKHQEHSQRATVSHSSQDGARLDTPERAVEEEIQIEHIKACMRELSKDKRIAVTMMLQGYSQKEAAKMLDWKIKKVENHSLRGKSELRACLRAKGVRA